METYIIVHLILEEIISRVRENFIMNIKHHLFQSFIKFLEIKQQKQFLKIILFKNNNNFIFK